VTGLFGFLLCVAGLLSIKITSPITHMFSSAARSVLQTALGIWIFGDILTTNRAASISLILAGTMLYTWIKSTEGAVAVSPPAKRGDVEMGTAKLRAQFDPSHPGNRDETSRVMWQVEEKK